MMELLPLVQRPDDTIGDRFVAVSLAMSDSIAIVDGRERFSYGNVNVRSDHAVSNLRMAGVRVGSSVAVCMTRGISLVCVLLAITKLGAIYIPLDPTLPMARRSFIIKDANCDFLVVDSFVPNDIPHNNIINAERLFDHAANDNQIDAFDEPSLFGKPAYIIYTSGTTGKPKGVVISHGSVLSLVSGATASLSIKPADTWITCHSIGFDVSIWEIFGSLLTGGTLVMASLSTCKDPSLLADLIIESNVSVLNQTPSAFSSLVYELVRRKSRLALRTIILAGEPLVTAILKPWFQAGTLEGIQLFNMYGITETTVHATFCKIDRHYYNSSSRSVGVALPGWKITVVGDDDRPLAVGIVGEIHVGGDGVALGYHNLTELTAARFYMSSESGIRMYRSGDRGYLQSDGSICCLGRADAQIKVRGYRVELGEIQAALLFHEQVAAAAVVASDDRLNPSITAFVAGDDVLLESVRSSLEQQLPDYMVPNSIHLVEQIPLNTNGKVDVDALACCVPLSSSPEQLSCDDFSDMGNDDRIRTILRAAWSEAVSTRNVLSSDFFRHGGSSLSAATLARRLKSEGFNVSVQDVFANSKFSAFEQLLRRRQALN